MKLGPGINHNSSLNIIPLEISTQTLILLHT